MLIRWFGESDHWVEKKAKERVSRSRTARRASKESNGCKGSQEGEDGTEGIWIQISDSKRLI